MPERGGEHNFFSVLYRVFCRRKDGLFLYIYNILRWTGDMKYVILILVINSHLFH